MTVTKPQSGKRKKAVKKPTLYDLVNKYKFKTKHPTNVLELLKKYR